MAYQSIEDVTRKMEHYCAYQERSHYQVEKKLREMQIIPQAIDHIILHLLQHDFLNEERFARAYVRGKFYQKQWGKRKIINGLYLHKIHQKLIDKALSEIEEADYQNTIRQLIDKKKARLKTGNSYTNRQKLIKYLLQKGYAFEDFIDYL